MNHKHGVVMLNFGEPEEPTEAEVLPFLERIFLNNATLEHLPDIESRKARCRELAMRRAPGLIEDFRRIGGSPLNRQARAEAAALEAELHGRGHDVRTFVGFQFMNPSIGDAVDAAREAGVQSLIGLPMYPLCGFSTNVAALRDMRLVLEEGWPEASFRGITAWHHNDSYTRLRAANVRGAADEANWNLSGPDTLLYFSAHGTPIKYLETGSRYDGYVEEHCRRIAHLLGDVPYMLGYQNHSNRGIAWTEPDNEANLSNISAERLLVEPVSFLHEQSETLAELDLDFRQEVEARGITYRRVPTPADYPRLAGILADLLEPLLTDATPASAGLHTCRCLPASGVVCTNGHRDIPCRYRDTRPAQSAP